MPKVVKWVLAILCFAAALVLAWRVNVDFSATDDRHVRVIVEAAAMILLTAPLAVLSRWRWGR